MGSEDPTNQVLDGPVCGVRGTPSPNTTCVHAGPSTNDSPCTCSYTRKPLCMFQLPNVYSRRVKTTMQSVLEDLR